ncbi:hypothetical protein VTJ49DRAFT_4584 [Mycothermus thermophilus]|uniref:Uncharacterized protein n=1 Tax=Humicola insolens TaxID=85995 RepID=A0ABR3V604_HUMIN
MCYFKRAVWDCGCPLGIAPARPCEHKGTPACQRRHLLEKLRANIACPKHMPPGGYPKRKKWVRWFYKVHPDGRVTRFLRKKKKAAEKGGDAHASAPVVAAEATETTTTTPVKQTLLRPTTPDAPALSGLFPPRRGRSASVSSVASVATTMTLGRETIEHGNGTGEVGVMTTATGLPTPQSMDSTTSARCGLPGLRAAPGSPSVDRAARRG